MEPFECFENGRVGFGLRFYRVEEVARVDEDVGFLVDDIIDCLEEIIVDLLLAEVHAALGIEAAEGGEAQVGVGDMDEFHR